MTAENTGPSSEEIHHLIVESSTDFAIIATDPAGYFTTWNSGAERLFGFRADEILGKSSDVIFTPEDRAAGIPEAERLGALSAGRSLDERWHLRKDDSRFW